MLVQRQCPQAISLPYLVSSFSLSACGAKYVGAGLAPAQPLSARKYSIVYVASRVNEQDGLVFTARPTPRAPARGAPTMDGLHATLRSIVGAPLAGALGVGTDIQVS